MSEVREAAPKVFKPDLTTIHSCRYERTDPDNRLRFVCELAGMFDPAKDGDITEARAMHKLNQHWALLESPTPGVYFSKDTQRWFIFVTARDEPDAARHAATCVAILIDEGMLWTPI